jgi:hypothetical protein
MAFFKAALFLAVSALRISSWDMRLSIEATSFWLTHPEASNKHMIFIVTADFMTGIFGFVEFILGKLFHSKITRRV